MIKAFLLLAFVGLVAWAILGPKQVMGTVTALYDDAKVSFTPSPSLDDQTGDGLISPAATY